MHDGSGLKAVFHPSECVNGFVNYGVSQEVQLRFGSGKFIVVGMYVVDNDVM